MIIATSYLCVNRTYIVLVHFSKTSREIMNDKIMCKLKRV
ncbi:MAG: hypothetical protein HFH89_05115 [Lachnospiraceae bacterium]|nr:hypothetical protein [Lachnospiraceae bacterium]